MTAYHYENEFMIRELETSVKTSIQVKNRIEKPIETEAEITAFGLNSMQIRSDSMVPIPSNGTVLFYVGHQKKPLQLDVNFLQRTEVKKRFWFMRSHKPEYVIRVSICDNSKEKVQEFQDYLHRYHIFSGSGRESDPQMDPGEEL